MSGVIADADADQVIERAGGHCEACGGPFTAAAEFHHRKRRGYGDHSAVNLMLVHAGLARNCHASIHSRVDRSRRLKHILYDYQVPADEPVVALRNLLELTE